MRFNAPKVLWITLCLFLRITIAVYEDSAYRNDFHHSLLGIPRSHATFFHRPSSTSKASLLYSLSEKNVVGAVNPKDGSLVWRQPIEKGVSSGNHSQSYLKAVGSEIISTANGLVRAWDAADGKLVWEWKAPGTVLGLELSNPEGEDTAVLVLSKDVAGHGYIARLVASTGQFLWQHKDDRYRNQKPLDKAIAD